MKIDNELEFNSHVLDCYPQEACGVVVNGVFSPLVNVHPSPADNFMISEQDSFSLISSSEDFSIVHSHTMDTFIGDPRTPSHDDMKSQLSLRVQWGIVHCDGENVSDILEFGKPNECELLGRRYISNVYDCFTIARDFYWQNYAIDFGSHPRPEKWEDWDPHYIENHYKELGFVDLAQGEPQKHGDVILFKIASNTVNHIGVANDIGKFIHHLHNRLSCVDSQDKWHKQQYKIIRRNRG